MSDVKIVHLQQVANQCAELLETVEAWSGGDACMACETMTRDGRCINGACIVYKTRKILKAVGR